MESLVMDSVKAIDKEEIKKARLERKLAKKLKRKQELEEKRKIDYSTMTEE